jgi:hypothetical protein
VERRKQRKEGERRKEGRKGNERKTSNIMKRKEKERNK